MALISLSFLLFFFFLLLLWIRAIINNRTKHFVRMKCRKSAMKFQRRLEFFLMSFFTTQIKRGKTKHFVRIQFTSSTANNQVVIQIFVRVHIWIEWHISAAFQQTKMKCTIKTISLLLSWVCVYVYIGLLLFSWKNIVVIFEITFFSFQMWT